MAVDVYLSLVVRKPVYAIYEQQGADQPAYPHSLISFFDVHCLNNIIAILAKSKISRLACLCNLAGRFESYLVANPKDGFSHDMAHFQDH